MAVPFVSESVAVALIGLFGIVVLASVWCYFLIRGGRPHKISFSGLGLKLNITPVDREKESHASNSE